MMDALRQLEIDELRLLWLISRRPQGLSARQLLNELKSHGWCDPDMTVEDLGLEPDDMLRRSLKAANDP